jgi:hypothetical protein
MRPFEGRFEDRAFIFSQLGVRNDESIQTSNCHRMNLSRFSRLAAARAGSSRLSCRLTAAVASVVCLWAFAAEGAPPANDNLAAATALPNTSVFGRNTTGSNVDATKEGFEPSYAGNNGGKSIWYRWTAPSTPSSGVVVFDTIGTQFDTLLAAFGTNAAGVPFFVGASDNLRGGYVGVSGGYLESRIGINVPANATLFIAVDGFNSGSGAASGPVVLNWNHVVGAPVNNDFSAATVLTGMKGGIGGRNDNATKEGPEPNHAGNVGGRSVWYRWTAPVSGDAVIDTMGSSVDTLLAVYTGNNLATLTLVAQNDDAVAIDANNSFIFQSRVIFAAVAGTTYQIAVDNFAGTPAGTIALHYNLSGTPPANDNFANAVTITGAKGQVAGSTLAATKQTGEPNHGQSVGSRSVWYNWTAPADGQVTFDTFGIYFDSLLAVYTGDAVDALTLVVEDDDIVDGIVQISRPSFQAVAGTTYRIAVDGYSDGTIGDYSAFTLNWEMALNAPTNDLFANAMVLPGSRGTLFTSNTTAVFEQDEPLHGPLAGKSLWFKWTSPRDRDVTITTIGSSFDTLLAVYSGNSLATLTDVAFNDDIDAVTFTSSVTFPATAGADYFIAVDGYNPGNGRGAENGTVVLNWSQIGGPPPNDNLVDAFELTGLSGTTNGFSFDATTETDEPDRGIIPANSSSWFRWTAPVSGWFTFDTLGGPLDTVLGIYTGTEFASFVEVGSNNNIDDGIPILQSRVTFLATGGVTYQIAVDGTFGAQDDFLLNWAPTALLSTEIVSGHLQLTLKVADGDMYKIQESTNLTSWGDVQTVSAGAGPVTIDAGAIAGIPRKFYRAIQAF